MNGRLTAFWQSATEWGIKLLVFALPLTFYIKTYNTGIVKEATLLAGVSLVWFCWVARQLEAGRFEWPANRTWLATLAKLLLLWAFVAATTNARNHVPPGRHGLSPCYPLNRPRALVRRFPHSHGRPNQPSPAQSPRSRYAARVSLPQQHQR